MIDDETGKEHVSPEGLQHQGLRFRNKVPLFYSNINMPHYIISLHQEAFPELKEQMKNNPKKAVAIYSAFLALLPLEMKGRLTPDERNRILKSFKVI